jgi:hypothetical protein
MVTMEKLIRDSKMDESEKTMWLELLPTMTEEHKNWLRANIEGENLAISQLEQKYGKVKTDEEKVKLRQGYIRYLTA